MTNKKRDIILSVVFAAVIVALLIYIDKEQHYSMLASVIQKASIYALLAVSLNLLNGFTGLFSLGQAGFMMLGAYTYAILTIPLEQHASVYQYFNGGIVNVCLPAFVGVIAAGLVAVVFAWLVGKPCLRLKSDYLAIATLGFAEILRALIQWEVLGPVTNASNILKKFPKFDSLLTPVIISAFCIFLIVLLINSSYGRAFKAIREDEIAAEAMGINLFKTKELSFVISSFFAGVSGGMLAMFMRSIDSKTFQVSLTYDILLIVVIGGIGSVTGSVLGAFLVTAGRELLRFFDEPLYIGAINIPLFRPGFRMVIFSILLMVVVLFYSRGLMGTSEFSWNGIIGFFRSFGKKKVKKARGKV